MRTVLMLLSICFLIPISVFSQDQGMIGEIKNISAKDMASAAQKAAEQLTSAAQDRLLIKDLLEAQIKGPQGNVIGKVVNLAVVPGGRIVAALIETTDGQRIAVPFTTIKVAKAAEKAQQTSLQLPLGLSELKGMKELQSLADKMQN